MRKTGGLRGVGRYAISFARATPAVPPNATGHVDVQLGSLTAAGTGSATLSATSGVLEKTPYSYLSRDSVATSIDYTSDFSVEAALYIHPAAHRGYYGEIMRHGAKNNAWLPVAGWAWHYGTDGYGSSGTNGSAFRLCDGTNAVECYPQALGLCHLVITWNATTKTLTPYKNGTAGNSYLNASVAMSTVTGPLIIGGYNFGTCGTDPNESAFSSSRASTPEFRLYYARIWQKRLTGTDVTNLYNNWNGTGRVDIPGTVSGTPVSEWLFHQQVGDSSGGAGTGWIKDNRGSNHIKIVSTNAYTGASGSTSSTYVPSGSPRIASPADGATDVSGGVTVRADGLAFTGDAMQYYIECDTANTFNTANLKNSGWTLTDGIWKPILDPSTTYYLRCKARCGNNTGVESGWSSTVSFSTRAATTYYARDIAAYGSYGSEDGTSYANAWNGLRHNGQQGGLDARKLARQADLRNLAPGDTLYMCGNWGLESSSEITQNSTLPRYQALSGTGTATNPINVRLDHGTYPGKVYKFRKYTGAISWTSEGSSTYSTTTYNASVDKYAADSAGVPDTGANQLTQSLLLNKGSGPLASAGYYISGGRLYVRMPDGSNPANNLWQASGYFQIVMPDARHVKIQGGEWYGTSPQITALASNPPKYITATLGKYKYIDTGYLGAFYIGLGCDNWTITYNDIGYCRNGIYAPNDADVAGQYGTATNNWIHHCGVTGWEDDDGHGIGLQAVENWTVADNLVEYCGTGIEQWSSTKYCRNNQYLRNVIRECTKHDVTYGAGIALTGGNLTAGYRTGTIIRHNAIYNTDAASLHLSTPDSVTVQYNLLMRPGRIAKGTGYEDFYWHCLQLSHQIAGEGADIDFRYNVAVSPYHHTDGGTVGRFLNCAGNLSTTASTYNIEDNLYWDGSPVTAATAAKFYHLGIGSGSFNTWKAIGTVDQNSTFADPDGGSLPTGFDSAVRDFFCQGTLGDFQGDADVDASDLTALEATSGDGPHWAMEKLLGNFVTYGTY